MKLTDTDKILIESLAPLHDLTHDEMLEVVIKMGIHAIISETIWYQKNGGGIEDVRAVFKCALKKEIPHEGTNEMADATPRKPSGGRDLNDGDSLDKPRI